METKLGATLDRTRNGRLGLVVRQTENVLSAPALFGTDGIRGIAGVAPLEKEFIARLGAAAAHVYKTHVSKRKPIFLIGRDTRGSGSWIVEAFARGARQAGIELRDIGIVSTPSLAYLVPARKVIGGIMISASHNPAEFNGIKFFGPSGGKCPDAWERLIEREVLAIALVETQSKKPTTDARALREYLAFLKKTLPARTTLKGMTLVVDCANGSLSKIAPAFLRSLGARVITIGDRPNGRNINAGCGSQHTEKMQKLVVSKKAHGGVAFDGDGDRAVFCDEMGRLLDGDYVLACGAHCFREEKRLANNTVVVTVMANLGLMKSLQEWGVKTVSTPVGDRYVSEALEKTRAIFGGEQSGHIIFRKHLPTGDGLLTAIQILSMLKRRKHPFSWMHSLMKKYPQVLLNVKVREKKPLSECPTIQSEIDTANQVLSESGRVVVRYSGTEPLLRIMLEGPDKIQLELLAENIARRTREVLA